MNAKQILILVLVLAALLAGIFLREKHPRPENVAQETVLLAPDFAPPEIREILIQKSPDEIKLVKNDTLWQVASLWNAKADQKKITDLLESVSKLEGEERANGTALFSDFGVGDGEALHLVLKGSETAGRHFLLGTKTNRWREIFLRRAGEDRIYVSSSDLLLNLGIYQKTQISKIDPNAWADLGLFSFDPDEITKAGFKETGPEWLEPGSDLPFEKDPGKIKKYYRELLTVKAASVADPNGAGYGFETPAWELRLTAADGSEKILSAGNPANGKSAERYVRVSGSNSIFRVPEQTLKQIKPEESRFIRSNPLAIGEISGITGLSVKTPQAKYSLSPKEKSWPGLENYISALKSFRVSKTKFSDRDKQKKREYQIEVKQDGNPSVKLSCGSLEGEEKEVSFCVNEENKKGFFVSKPVFQSLFEDLDGLRPPPENTSPQAQP